MTNNVKPLRPLSPEKAIFRIIGSGPNFPFIFSSTGRVKSVEISDGIKKINQSIHIILNTRRGERIMLPEFGCFTGDTEILLITGERVPIFSLMGVKKVTTFGVIDKAGTSSQPPRTCLVPASTGGAISKGLRDVIELTLSNGKTVKCTPDHLFLTPQNGYVRAEDSQGVSLSWIDRAEGYLGARVAAWKQSQRVAVLCDMPMSRKTLSVVEVRLLEAQEEVFDLPDSTTQNYSLAAGPVVHNSNLERLVFEPNDDILLPQLQFETEEAISRWEKRIALTNISFVSPEEVSLNDLLKLNINPRAISSARDNSWIGIFIEYIVKQMHVKGSYVYPFVRDPMAMSDTITGGNI